MSPSLSPCTPNADPGPLWRAYRAGPTVELRNRLVEHYMPWVRQVAAVLRARLTDNAPPVDDLAHMGLFGLLRALESFDLARGNRFTTFAYRRVWGGIMDELRRQDWVPRSARQRDEPTPVVLSLARRWDSDGEEDTRYVSSGLTDRGPGPATRQQQRDLVESLTRHLDRADRLILILYYFDELTMREIGEVVGLSESRVSQRHTSLMERLRERLAGREYEFVA